MAQAIKCDRCEAFFTRDFPYYKAGLSRIYHCLTKEEYDRDLCPSCYEELKLWLGIEEKEKIK